VRIGEERHLEAGIKAAEGVERPPSAQQVLACKHREREKLTPRQPMPVAQRCSNRPYSSYFLFLKGKSIKQVFVMVCRRREY
jgi:hypothetical protein